MIVSLKFKVLISLLWLTGVGVGIIIGLAIAS
jgi:hypothetical protein